MTKRLQDMQDKRAAKVVELRGLVKDDASDDDRTKFDALEKEVRALDADIRRETVARELEREAPAETVAGETRGMGDLSRYSLARAVQANHAGHLPDGLEGEVHAELARGRAEVRGVMVPTSVLLEHRAVKTTTPQAGPGGNLVGRQTMPVTEHPRPALMVEQMGATVMRDLTGNVDLPRLTESGTVAWVAEHNDVPRTDPRFGKASMTPKTVGGEYELSRRMILQASTAIEELMRRDLGFLLRKGLDSAAIAGAGGVEPLGILNTPGVQEVTGGPLDSDLTAEMIGALELDDLMGSTGFLTNPAVAKAARQSKDGDGHVYTMAELFHGQTVNVTTQVPSTGGGTNDKPLAIYGQWSELVIGYWSGVDILVNPYHADVASKGGVLIHAFLDADVVVREPLAFNFAAIG